MLKQLSRWRERYRREATVALVVAATLVLLLTQVSDSIGNFVSGAQVLAYVTLIIVADLALAVDRVMSRVRYVRVSSEQDSLLPTLLEVADDLPESSNADLLEYAGISITPLIRRLRSRHAHIRILIKHPETCARYQRQRTESNLEALLGSVLSGYEGNYEVRCYRAPYSLRGRRVGRRFLELGWLTPDFARDTAFGRVNASVFLDPTVEDGHYLGTLFERTFEDLWNHPATVDAHTIVTR